MTTSDTPTHHADALTQAMQGGIVFKGSKLTAPTADKVRTKAKKKGYVTGSHGSGAAKKKADIRTKRANRHKK
jgi:hypothetical protein